MSEAFQSSWDHHPERDDRIACHYCDTLHHRQDLEDNTQAHCQQCGHVIYYKRPRSLPRVIALCVTALSLIPLIFIFPFFSLEKQGLFSTVSVPKAILGLWQAGELPIATFVALCILILPTILLSSLLYVCLPLLKEQALPGTARILRTLQTLSPWVMVEVFFLSSIVSLFKLFRTGDVTLGIGFWATAAIMLCIAGITQTIDRIELWERLESVNWKKRGL